MPLHQNLIGFAAVAFLRDPHLSSVVSLLNFQGADGSTTFIDYTGKTWTPAGDAQIDTSLGYQTGQFDGAGDYLTTGTGADWNMGSGAFTLEAWVRPNSPTGTFELIFNSRASGVGTATGMQLGYSTAGFQGNVWTSSGTGFGVCLGGTAVANTLAHVAYQRSGSDFALFVDGASVATASSASTVGNASTVNIGRSPAATGTFYLNGRLRALRLTKGVARYTAPFTPPPAPFPEA